MSSTTATPSRKAMSDAGTRRPSAARAARANATSVAIGMPHPPASPEPAVSPANIRAGTTTPPRAANVGSSAACRVDSSPSTSSRFTSSPMTRKKIVIRPSFTTWSRSSVCDQSPIVSVRSVLQKDS
jgi:hypothetical protein